MDYDEKQQLLIVHLPTELDDHTCKQVKQETDGCLRRQTVRFMVFDFSRTEFLDSSGVGILLERYKRMRQSGGELVIRGVQPRVDRILRMSGVYRLVKVVR